jgi:hypothetical protein
VRVAQSGQGRGVGGFESSPPGAGLPLSGVGLPRSGVGRAGLAGDALAAGFTSMLLAVLVDPSFL